MRTFEQDYEKLHSKGWHEGNKRNHIKSYNGQGDMKVHDCLRREGNNI